MSDPRPGVQAAADNPPDASRTGDVDMSSFFAAIVRMVWGQPTTAARPLGNVSGDLQPPGGLRRSGDIPDHDTIQAELQKFATEFLLFVTPAGELVATSTFNTLGYEEDERSGHHIAEHIHPDDLPKIFDIIERARRTAGFDEQVLARARHKDGSWRLFDARVYDAALRSHLIGSVLRVRDITDEHNARVVGDNDHDRFLSLAEMLPLGILSGDARGWAAFCNEAAQQIFDLPEDLILGHGWEKTIVDDDRLDVIDAVGRAIATGRTHQVTFRIATGQYQRWAHAKIVPLASDGRVTGWIATVDDITDRRRAESELAHQATHDALTDLPNRMLLEDRLRQAAGRLRRDSTSITVCFVDLDGFKDVNDTHGHHAGDAVLVEIGRRLRRIMRDVDTVARLGGDEFVAICESLPATEVDSLVRRVVESFDVPLLVGGESLSIGASVGIARTEDPNLDTAELLATADQAMYREKRRRKRR